MAHGAGGVSDGGGVEPGLSSPMPNSRLQKPRSSPSPPASATPEPQAEDPARVKLLMQLSDLMKGSGITKEELGAELARKGVVPADMNPRQYNVQTLNRVVGKWDAVLHNINLARQKAA